MIDINRWKDMLKVKGSGKVLKILYVELEKEEKIKIFRFEKKK